jgi:hypothetical protein
MQRDSGVLTVYQRSSAMTHRILMAAGIALALSAPAFADDAAKAGGKTSSASGDATAVAQCEKLTGADKTSCLQQARASHDSAATGATSGSASGRAASSQKEAGQKQ